MRRNPLVLAAATGGMLVMLGAALPWLTLFAGLQQYRGLIGLNGKLLFAGGTIAVVAGAAVAQRDRPVLARSTAVLGGLMAGFAIWLLVGVQTMVASGLGAMLVPRVGPGLFVALSGSLLIGASPFLQRAVEPAARAGGDARGGRASDRPEP